MNPTFKLNVLDAPDILWISDNGLVVKMIDHITYFSDPKVRKQIDALSQLYRHYINVKK